AREPDGQPGRDARGAGLGASRRALRAEDAFGGAATANHCQGCLRRAKKLSTLQLLLPRACCRRPASLVSFARHAMAAARDAANCRAHWTNPTSIVRSFAASVLNSTSRWPLRAIYLKLAALALQL